MNRQEYIETMRKMGFSGSEIDEYLDIADEMSGGEELPDYEPFVPPYIDIDD